MAHDKSRSSVNVGAVDWNDPNLGALLQKVDGWSLDQRSSEAPLAVTMHLSSGFTADSVVSKPAHLLALGEQGMVLLTGFPLPAGERVRVDCPRDGATHAVWGLVTESREGGRGDDKAKMLFLHRLRLA